MSNEIKTKTIFWYILGALIGSLVLWEIGYYLDDLILNQFPNLEYDDPALNFFYSPENSTNALERTNEMNFYRFLSWLLVIFFHVPLIYFFSYVLKSKFNKSIQPTAKAPAD